MIQAHSSLKERSEARINWRPQSPPLPNARGWIRVVPWSIQSPHLRFAIEKTSLQRADRSPALYAGRAAGTESLLFCRCLRSLCVPVDIYNLVCFLISVLSPREQHVWYNSSGIYKTQVSCEWWSFQGRYVTSCIYEALSAQEHTRKNKQAATLIGSLPANKLNK